MDRRHRYPTKTLSGGPANGSQVTRSEGISFMQGKDGRMEGWKDGRMEGWKDGDEGKARSVEGRFLQKNVPPSAT